MVLTRHCRAFRSDTRVLRLNWDILRADDERSWPSPLSVAKCIRYLIYPIQMTVLGANTIISLLSRRADSCRNRSEEEGASETKSSRDDALNECQTALEYTFDDQERISLVMEGVEFWIDNE